MRGAFSEYGREPPAEKVCKMENPYEPKWKLRKL